MAKENQSSKPEKPEQAVAQVSEVNRPESVYITNSQDTPGVQKRKI